MTTTEQILGYKRMTREMQVAEAKDCVRIANYAAKKVSGNRLKSSGAMSVVEALEKHVENLEKNLPWAK